MTLVVFTLLIVNACHKKQDASIDNKDKQSKSDIEAVNIDKNNVKDKVNDKDKTIEPPKADDTIGKVFFVSGNVDLNRNNEKKTLNKDDVLKEGDIIKTSTNGVAVLSLNDDKIKLEVQYNTELELNKLLGKDKSIKVDKGNVWTKVEKLNTGDKFSVNTPQTVAGVRGTIFYTFQAGDMWATCHCQGDVDYSDNGGKYHQEHHQDYLTFTKGDKTIVLTPEEMKKAFKTDTLQHNHSVLPDSPLGPEAQKETQEHAKIMSELIEKKFKELK